MKTIRFGAILAILLISVFLSNDSKSTIFDYALGKLSSEGKLYCSGALIGPRHFVAPARCFSPNRDADKLKLKNIFFIPNNSLDPNHYEVESLHWNRKFADGHLEQNWVIGVLATQPLIPYYPLEYAIQDSVTQESAYSYVGFDYDSEGRLLVVASHGCVERNHEAKKLQSFDCGASPGYSSLGGFIFLKTPNGEFKLSSVVVGELKSKDLIAVPVSTFFSIWKNLNSRDSFKNDVLERAQHSHVSLEWKGEIFCKGALVAPNLVLTAAHCLAKMSCAYTEARILIWEPGPKIKVNYFGHCQKIVHVDYSHDQVLMEVKFSKADGNPYYMPVRHPYVDENQNAPVGIYRRNENRLEPIGTAEWTERVERALDMNLLGHYAGRITPATLQGEIEINSIEQKFFDGSTENFDRRLFPVSLTVDDDEMGPGDSGTPLLDAAGFGVAVSSRVIERFLPFPFALVFPAGGRLQNGPSLMSPMAPETLEIIQQTLSE